MVLLLSAQNVFTDVPPRHEVEDGPASRLPASADLCVKRAGNVPKILKPSQADRSGTVFRRGGKGRYLFPLTRGVSLCVTTQAVSAAKGNMGLPRPECHTWPYRRKRKQVNPSIPFKSREVRRAEKFRKM